MVAFPDLTNCLVRNSPELFRGLNAFPGISGYFPGSARLLNLHSHIVHLLFT